MISFICIVLYCNKLAILTLNNSKQKTDSTCSTQRSNAKKLIKTLDTVKLGNTVRHISKFSIPINIWNIIVLQSIAVTCVTESQTTS